MMIPKVFHLFLWAVLLPLVFSIPMDHHPKEHPHHKSLHGIEVRVPESPGRSKDPPTSTHESPSDFQKAPPNANKESAVAGIHIAEYHQLTGSYPPSPAIVQKLTSLSEEDDANSPPGFHISPDSKTKSIGTMVRSQEPPASAVQSPGNHKQHASENILQRVKRQRGGRRRPNNRIRNSGGGRGGSSQSFCNQFGCNSSRGPVRSPRNSRCPNGTRFDSRSNRCRRLSGR